jgi:23S rRNA (guanosine2251-2'-O)-methyltransferase
MIFYGINPVLESLRSPYTPERVYVEQGKGKSNPRINGIIKLARESGIVVETVADLRQLCRSSQHQGVAAEISGLGMRPLEEVSILGDQVLMLDSIQDPHNFGAALRVCDALGFPDVIYFKGNSSGVTPAAIKVSTGAVFHLNLFQSNLNRAIKRLKEAGYRIVVLEAEGDASIYDADYSGKLCLVMGSEGAGVRHNILRQADQVMSIPMSGHVTSLNVSCALTAVLSEMARRRQA